MADKTRSGARFALGMAVAVLLCGVLIWKIEPRPIGAAIGRGDLGLLASALCISILSNSVLSAELFGHVLRAVGVHLSRRAVLGATLENMALQAALPFAAGHASRAAHLVRVHGADKRRATLSVGLLLALKLVALAVLALAGLAGRYPFASALAAALVALAFVIARRARSAEPRALGWSLFWAVVITALQVAMFVLILAALQARVPVAMTIARFPLCLLLAKLPVAWMGFGTREAAVLVAFSGATGTPSLVAASLLFGVIDQIVPGVLGAVFAPRLVSQWRQGQRK